MAAPSLVCACSQVLAPRIGTPHRPRRLAILLELGLDRRHERRRALRNRDEARYAHRLELGQGDRNDRLPCGEHFVHLDRIRRLGQRRMQERDDAAVPAHDQRGQLVVPSSHPRASRSLRIRAAPCPRTRCSPISTICHSGRIRAIAATSPLSNQSAIAPK